MRTYDIIKKKRDGYALSDEEIRFFIDGYTRGEIPDYQAAALLMATYFKGMTDAETLALTLAIADSGEKMDLSAIKGYKADKHSSGGVGDKTTLVVAPIVAACGVKVAKMSGRGLGHTGGTVDKLSAIPGFKTTLSTEEFVKQVNDIGIAVIGQSGELAPADKRLYALRDVTATVDSTPLIASSIMGKKLASADDGIVLDVKVGSGSFNKTKEKALALAKSMVAIGSGAGKNTVALLTDMDRPLGRTVGNALEVIEAVETLMGCGEKRFLTLCVELSAQMLFTAGLGGMIDCIALAQKKIQSGEAMDKFREMVMAQGGDTRYVDDVSLFDTGKTYEVKSQVEGYITAIDTEQYGIASLLLGAGRNRKEDSIDLAAGIEVKKNVGDYLSVNDTIAVLHASDDRLFPLAAERLIGSLAYGSAKPIDIDVVMGKVYYSDGRVISET